MEEKNDNINNDNDNDNDDSNNNDSPIQRRGLLSAAMQYITTPLRRQTRTTRQAVLDRQIQIQNIEADLGLDQTILFGEEEDQQKNEEQKEEEENEEEEEEDKDENRFETINMPTTTYTLGGMSVEFDNDDPTQNIDYEVGVVISKANQPSHGSEGERKLIEGI
jgi:hypothetical protein